MTRPAFEEYLRDEPVPVALIPVGSIEQHGPHLPLGMDSLAVLNICKRLAEKANCVVVQTCLPGYSPHHMEFKGTITYHEETLIAVLYDTIESLVYHGITKIMLINGHGGNAQILAYVARMASREYGCTVLQPPMPAPGDPIVAAKDALTRFDVHSGTGETGTALNLFPQFVEMERVKNYKPAAAFYEGAQHLASPEGDDLELRAFLVRAYVGDTHEHTQNGVYGFTDPNEADPAAANRRLEQMTDQYAKLIKLWRTIPERE
jgi:creatinine amidohydrolase